MLKIVQNWGKIANYPPNAQKQRSATMLNKDRHHCLESIVPVLGPASVLSTLGTLTIFGKVQSNVSLKVDVKNQRKKKRLHSKSSPSPCGFGSVSFV